MPKSKGVSSHTHTQQQLNDYANQMNPNSAAYKANMNNHANQLNQNHSEYHGEKNK